jgi:hypothetical protein
MNDLTTRGGRSVARAAAPLPGPVETYIKAVAAFADQHARWMAASPEEREGMYLGSRPVPPALTGPDRDAAVQAIRAMDGPLSPVTLAQLGDWLAPVNLASRNPQPEREFTARVRGIAAMVDDLPCGAFTAETRRSLPGFFPSADDVRKAVEPEARRLRAKADALDAALWQQPQQDDRPQPRPERTPEEIAAARAKVEEFMAERNAATATQREAMPAMARPLSEGHLILQYEKIIAEAKKLGQIHNPHAEMARMRLNALRAKHARELAQEAAE